jgi:hypothetical protein
MSTTTLSAPGSECGPCLDPCGHKDCQEIRHIAQSDCAICSLTIGYDREIMMLADGEIAHYDCLFGVFEKEG